MEQMKDQLNLEQTNMDRREEWNTGGVIQAGSGGGGGCLIKLYGFFSKIAYTLYVYQWFMYFIHYKKQHNKNQQQKICACCHCCQLQTMNDLHACQIRIYGTKNRIIVINESSTNTFLMAYFLLTDTISSTSSFSPWLVIFIPAFWFAQDIIPQCLELLVSST